MVVGNGDVARCFADFEALGGPFHAFVAKGSLTDAAVQFQSVAQVEEFRTVKATNGMRVDSYHLMAGVALCVRIEHAVPERLLAQHMIRLRFHRAPLVMELAQVSRANVFGNVRSDACRWKPLAQREAHSANCMRVCSDPGVPYVQHIDVSHSKIGGFDQHVDQARRQGKRGRISSAIALPHDVPQHDRAEIAGDLIQSEFVHIWIKIVEASELTRQNFQIEVFVRTANFAQGRGPWNEARLVLHVHGPLTRFPACAGTALI